MSGEHTHTDYDALIDAIILKNVEQDVRLQALEAAPEPPPAPTARLVKRIDAAHYGSRDPLYVSYLHAGDPLQLVERDDLLVFTMDPNSPRSSQGGQRCELNTGFWFEYGVPYIVKHRARVAMGSTDNYFITLQFHSGYNSDTEAPDPMRAGPCYAVSVRSDGSWRVYRKQMGGDRTLYRINSAVGGDFVDWEFRVVFSNNPDEAQFDVYVNGSKVALEQDPFYPGYGTVVSTKTAYLKAGGLYGSVSSHTEVECEYIEIYNASNA